METPAWSPAPSQTTEHLLRGFQARPTGECGGLGWAYPSNELEGSPMRCRPVHRLFAAGAVAFSTLLFGSSAAAAIPLPPPGPGRVDHSVSDSGDVPIGVRRGFRCYVPTLAVITPQATAMRPGWGRAPTDGGHRRRSRSPSNHCIDVTANWQNLSSGDTGTTEIRRMPPDYSRPGPDALHRMVPIYPYANSVHRWRHRRRNSRRRRIRPANGGSRPSELGVQHLRSPDRFSTRS